MARELVFTAQKALCWTPFEETLQVTSEATLLVHLLGGVKILTTFD